MKQNSTVLITGANRGLGLGFVKTFLKDNYKIIATVRDPSSATQLSSLKGDIEIFKCEITDEQQRQQLKKDLKNKPIDILINNAGIFGPSGIYFGSANEKDWHEVMQTDCFAPVLLAQELIDNVKQSTQKKLVFITSRMGSIADNTSGGRIYYRSSKAALNSVVKTMAIDLQKENIMTLSLHPGWVQTSMGGDNAQLTPEESAERLKAIMDKATLKDSGSFISHTGGELPY